MKSELKTTRASLYEMLEAIDNAETDEARDEAFDELNNRGLCLDYEPRGDYFAWVWTTGGPHIEIRLYVSISGRISRASINGWGWFGTDKCELNIHSPVVVQLNRFFATDEMGAELWASKMSRGE